MKLVLYILCILLLCVLCQGAHILPSLTADVKKIFSQFTNFFKKKYIASDLKRRLQIFTKNFNIIRNLNKKNKKFQVEINELADMTEEEKQLMKGLVIDESRMKNKKNKINSVNIALVENSVNDAPRNFSWVDKGKVTKPIHQGLCGSCWAFSGASVIESRLAIKFNTDPVRLSVQHLVDCGKGDGKISGCSAGLYDLAFHYFHKNGIVDEVSYPYKARWLKECPTFPKEKLTIPEKINIAQPYKEIWWLDEKAMLKAVDEGPVSVAIWASAPEFEFYKSGIITTGAPPKETPQRVDHGIVIVGYGTEDGIDYWVIKNSWGENWGEKGYARIIRNKNLLNIGAHGMYPVL